MAERMAGERLGTTAGGRVSTEAKKRIHYTICQNDETSTGRANAACM